MNIQEHTKRISIDLPESLISRFDLLRKEWGLRSRGPVIERLLREILEEEEFQPINIQQNINFESIDKEVSFQEFDENSSLVLSETKDKETNNKNIYIESSSKETINSKTKMNINLPNFVGGQVKNLKRSLNSEKLKETINDYEINNIKEEDIIKSGLAINHHWINLYGSQPNEYILESSMEWLGRDIWPNLEGTENLPFTWTAANKLMREICPFWRKESASFELVILIAGVLEDPFATSDLINRVPTLVRRFVNRFKRKSKSNSFEALDSTMTVIGALKLLNLTTAPGSSHTLMKVREAYKRKAIKSHPDSGGSNEEMRKLNEAYQLLKNLYRK